MSIFINEPKLKPYDCIYQGWGIICFAHPDKNQITMPDSFPYVCGVFDNKDYAIEIAKQMQTIGKKRDGKNYHFIVQGMAITGYYPIVGLGNEVSIEGILSKADISSTLI